MNFRKWLGLKEKFLGQGFWATTERDKTRGTTLNSGEVTWSGRCRYYDSLVDKHPLAKSQIIKIAGQVTEQGIHLEPARFGDDEKHHESALECVDVCEELNDKIGMVNVAHQASINIAKYGSCFVRITTDPEFDVWVPIYQPEIEPLTVVGDGEITTWKQVHNGVTVEQFTNEEIFDIPFNKTMYSWPYGTSMLAGMQLPFEIMEQLQSDIKEFMHKNAFPEELYQVGDKDGRPTTTEIDTIKKEIANWQPGEKHVTSYTIARVAGGTGEKSIAHLNDVLGFMKAQCVDGTLTAPVSFMYNSTYASSVEMQKAERANLIVPLQRLIGEAFEKYVYKPYLEWKGKSVKLCPSVIWEPPDAALAQHAQMYANLVSAGILTPEVAAEKLGFGDRIEEMKKQKEENMKRQQEFQQEQQQFSKVQPVPDMRKPKGEVTTA